MFGRIRPVPSRWFPYFSTIFRLSQRTGSAGVFRGNGDLFVFGGFGSAESEGQLFELDGEVDAGDGEPVGDGEGDGGEIEDASDAGGDHLVGDLLGGFGRDAEDGESNFEAFDGFGHLLHRLNGDVVGDFLGVDFFRIVVENSDELKSLFGKSAVSGEGLPEIAGADDADVARLVGAEDFFDLGDEVVDAISNARVAKLAEVGEVFSDLGVGELEGFAELLAGDGAPIGFSECFELPEV